MNKTTKLQIDDRNGQAILEKQTYNLYITNY